MYGWTADEVLGRNTLEVTRLEMSYEERADVRDVVAEHGRWRGEVVLYRKDGTPVSVDLIIVALRGERGAVTGYLGIHRDVSERKRAEEDLRKARRRSEAILESISDWFYAVDREWRYTFVNERALAEAGRIPGRNLGAADLLGRTVWEVFPELVGTAFDREAHRALPGAGCGGVRDALPGLGAVDGCPPVPVGSGAVDLPARHQRAQAGRAGAAPAGRAAGARRRAGAACVGQRRSAVGAGGGGRPAGPDAGRRVGVRGGVAGGPR